MTLESFGAELERVGALISFSTTEMAVALIPSMLLILLLRISLNSTLSAAEMKRHDVELPRDLVERLQVLELAEGALDAVEARCLCEYLHQGGENGSISCSSMRFEVP